MVRLLGDVAASRGNHASKKQMLMKGLCRLVGADFWIWALVVSYKSSELPVFVNAYNGGFRPTQLVRFLKVLDHPDMKKLNAPFTAEMAKRKTHLTRLRQQVDPTGLFARLPVYRLWEDVGIGPILFSFRPIEGNMISGVTLYRRFDKPLFTAREARIAHILLTEIPWLHTLGWVKGEASRIPGLTSRQRAVLNSLIQGMNRKEIAAGLAISEHTVNDHVKVIYRFFRVNSQAQLINRFFRGDGGDKGALGSEEDGAVSAAQGLG